MHRAKDRAVAGAAAKMPIEVVFDLAARRGRIVAQERVHAHDETRRAEPTLRSVVSRDPVLHLIELLSYIANSFRRRHGHPVNRTDRQQAGVHASVDDLPSVPVEVRQHHRAGATPSFFATDLIARITDGRRAQKIHEKKAGIRVLQRELLSIHMKYQVVLGLPPEAGLQVAQGIGPIRFRFARHLFLPGNQRPTGNPVARQH